MKYIGAIINIAIGLAIVLFGSVGISDYFDGNKKKIERYQALLDNGTTITGILDSVYTETSIKGIKLYSSKYFFNVDGVDYEGTFSFDSPDDLGFVIPVQYMPNNPNIHDVLVDKKLAKAIKSKDSNFSLILGLSAILLGSALIYFRGLRRFRNIITNDYLRSAYPEEDDYV